MAETRFGGIRPVIFEDSAWDIAVATAYLTDVTKQEPQILDHYAALTAALDDAVGAASPTDSAAAANAGVAR